MHKYHSENRGVNMKKIILSVFLLLISSLGAFAKDVIPVSPNIVSVSTVGLYQVGDDITIYKFPDENSQILYRVRWNSEEFFPAEIGENNFFGLLIAKKLFSPISAEHHQAQHYGPFHAGRPLLGN